MKIRRKAQRGTDPVKRVLKAVHAIESYRHDWFVGQDTTDKAAASTGVVVKTKITRRPRGRFLRYKPVASEQGHTYHPEVVDAKDGAEEVLRMGDDGNVLYYAFGSDTPEEVGVHGLSAMAERLEWLVKQMRRHPAACNIDGYSIGTPHRAE